MPCGCSGAQAKPGAVKQAYCAQKLDDDQEVRGVPASIPTHVSVPSCSLLIVNRTCWLKPFLDGVYLRVWTRAALPPHDWRAKIIFEVIVMEALCDLLQPRLVGMFIL